MSTQAFLYTGGHFIDRIAVARREALASKPYAVDLGTSILSLSAESANALLIDLATVLYDSGDLTMDVAERMQYLAGSVIVDAVAAAPQKCPNCGGNGATGPDYDPDPCNACRGTGIKA